MKKLYILITIIISVFTFNVYATNDVDYTLKITDDFKFEESIKYSLTDYKQITNGENYFSSIVYDDVYTDIMYNTKYTKTKKKQGNRYIVTLKHTYSEYSFSNSKFLNNCFKKSNYKYDMNKYKFTGSQGFYCDNADTLKITVITNMSVTSSNATENGNTYTWNPQDENFTMSMNITKEYKSQNESSQDYGEDYDKNGQTTDKEDNTQNNNSDQTQNSNQQTDNKQTTQDKKNNPYAGIIIASVFILLSVITIIIIIVLKNKKNSLNKI